MFTISKQFSFCASHHLSGLAEGHPCARLHGHNYTVDVILQAKTLDSRAFVMDFRDLAPFKAYLDNSLDHRSLNDVMKQPTSEALAYHLYNQALMLLGPAVVAVRVGETPTSWAEYRP